MAKSPRRAIGDPGPRHHSRPAGIRIFRPHSLDPLRPQDHAEFQQADRTLSRRRRLQDRLHLRVRLQSGGLRHPQRQAADRRRARRLLRPERAVEAAQMLERGFTGNSLAWLRPSLGTVEIWRRSTPRRRTCATRCAAASARSRTATRTTTTSSECRGVTHGDSPGDVLPRRIAAAMVHPSRTARRRACGSAPIVVCTGPTRTGAALMAAVAAEPKASDAASGKRPGRRRKSLTPRPNESPRPASAKSDAKSEAKSETPSRSRSAEAAAARHANAKPDAAPKPAEKPVPRRTSPPRSRPSPRRQQSPRRRKAQAARKITSEARPADQSPPPRPAPEPASAAPTAPTTS